VERLVTASAPMPVPWPPEARDALVSLLGAGRAAIPVWEAFDQADAWTRLIPEWGVVRSAPQRNPVHTYAVDRHLVEAAAQAASYTRHVDRPDLLLVGALLHDIGKGRPGDHTEAGIALVEQIAPRWGFDEADSAVLVDLVRYHLLLPDVATRRDLDDPATVAAVVAAVREPRLLDLLHALTEADALATGPMAWSDWKKSLVDDLVARVRAALAGTAHDAEPTLTAEQRALAASEDPSAVLVTVEHGGTLPTVTVAAADRVGLLATVAGVLSVLRLDVRAARTETIGSRAVTVWTVAPPFGEAPPAERVREEVRRALDGSLDVEAALARRESAYQGSRAPEPAPPHVDVVPGASGRATVIEVRAHDVPGLLHRVGRALAAADVSITAAQVATLGSEVVDVFYVVDRLGQPLSEGHAAAARTTVLAALGAVP
jgi:[protein-PII] uridylyltransferase